MVRWRVPRRGWWRDLPDPRDELPTSETLAPYWALVKPGAPVKPRSARSARVTHVDLAEYLPAVEAAPWPEACAAASIVTLLQYFERRASGQLIEPSVAFVQQVARRLEGNVPSMSPSAALPASQTAALSGATLRGTLKAIVRFGIPPAELWSPEHDERGPWNDGLLFGFARDYAALRYVRLDAPEAAGGQVLRVVKSFLQCGFAAAFGCVLPNALSSEAEIPFPTRQDTAQAAQCLVAVGYDDQRRIRSTRGALRVRSPWGETWGEAGDGWLPYRYVEERLAADFWTLIERRWLESGEFERPAVVE